MSSFRFVSVLTILVAATWPLVGQTPSTKPALTFAKGQRVYVVGVDSRSRDASITAADLALERYAKNAFKRHKVFQVANTLRDANFVFFVMTLPREQLTKSRWQCHRLLIRKPMGTLTLCGMRLFDNPTITSSTLRATLGWQWPREDCPSYLITPT